MNKKIIFKQENSIDLVLKIPGRAQAINICIPLWGFISFVLFFSICVGILLFFAVSGFKNELSVLSAKNLKKEMEQEKYDYIKLKEDIRLLEQSLQDLEVTQENYERLFKRKYIKKNYRQKIKFLDLEKTNRSSKTPLEKEHIKQRVETLKNNTLALKENYRLISDVLTVLKDSYKTIPSISPTYGYIRSRYGYRVHPVTGKWRFHKGIDIPSWTGAPVRATADGEVETSGYYGSYGWLIVLRHTSGYRTYYAHLSKTLVEVGYYVEKGQLIGTVGNTGLSTGPHLHYEVRKIYKNTHLSPVSFLNLDLFAALQKL